MERSLVRLKYITTQVVSQGGVDALQGKTGLQWVLLARRGRQSANVLPIVVTGLSKTSNLCKHIATDLNANGSFKVWMPMPAIW